MADIKLQEYGFERDDVYDKYGEKIGVAVYDLDDAQIRANIVKMKDDLKALGEKYEKLEEELKANAKENKDGLPVDKDGYPIDEDKFPIHAIALSELNVQCVEEMIVLVDSVFGEKFCANAAGEANKNPSVLWEVIAAVMENYGVKAKDEMRKFTNRAGRRAGAKAGAKK